MFPVRSLSLIFGLFVLTKNSKDVQANRGRFPPQNEPRRDTNYSSFNINHFPVLKPGESWFVFWSTVPQNEGPPSPQDSQKYPQGPGEQLNSTPSYPYQHRSTRLPQGWSHWTTTPQRVNPTVRTTSLPICGGYYSRYPCVNPGQSTTTQNPRDHSTTSEPDRRYQGEDNYAKDPFYENRPWPAVPADPTTTRAPRTMTVGRTTTPYWQQEYGQRRRQPEDYSRIYPYYPSVTSTVSSATPASRDSRPYCQGCDQGRQSSPNHRQQYRRQDS